MAGPTFLIGFQSMWAVFWGLTALQGGLEPSAVKTPKGWSLLLTARSAKTGFLANRVFACVTFVIFVIFVVFRGLRSKSLVFVDRVSIRHFRRFRQNPLFSVGGKDPVWVRPRFSPPDLRLGLFYLRLVFVAYGHLAWSFFLRLKFGLVLFCLWRKIGLVFFLRFPPVWTLDLVFFTHGSPTVSRKRRAVSKKTSTVQALTKG